jgi:hypothetical protein
MKSAYKTVITIFLVVATASPCRSQEGIETKPVHFADGTSSSNAKGTLVGYQIIDYTLGAKAGQTMTIHLQTDHTANYFNVLPPETEQAIFIGSTTGNDFSGPLPVDGVYRVRVYLMRSAARRNEKANFSISFSITGNPGSTDAKVAGTPYHATGKVPCSVGPDPKGSAQCEFGVIRKGAGQAEVHVSAPGGEKRILIFNGNKVECPDPDVKLKAGYINYNYEISVNDFEFFTIPEAVINGG